MDDYNKVSLKLSDSQLNKLKTAVKNRQGLTLRMNIKIFKRKNLFRELLLTTKLRNALENNISTDIKLSRAQHLK